VTVAEVMKASDLTHGVFYTHFASTEELEEAAVAGELGIGQAALIAAVQRRGKRIGKKPPSGRQR
jgi:TetR/AcrR family transcriptional regulator, transcriptional repressor for nem operon